MIIDNNINEIRDHLKSVIKNTIDPKDIEILVNSYKNIGTPVIIDNNIPVNGEFHYKNGIDDGKRLAVSLIARDLKDFEDTEKSLASIDNDSIARNVNQTLIAYCKDLIERLSNKDE